MTKQDELAAWERFASSIPTDSYTKGAIYTILEEVRAALQSDFIPTVSIHEASRKAFAIIKEAQDAAGKLLRDAHQQKAEIIEAAEKKAMRFEEQFELRKYNLIKELKSL